MPTAPARPCANSLCPHIQPCPVHGTAKQYQRKRHDAVRTLDPVRHWYWTGRWKASSKRFLKQPENVLCIDCKAEGRTVVATVVDHDTPHKGNEQLFWDESNWRARCTHHHNQKTAKEDGGFGRPGAV